MHRAGCGVLACAVPGAIAAGKVPASPSTWRAVAIFVLLALVWYPFDRFTNDLAGWGPRPPTDQDRT